MVIILIITTTSERKAGGRGKQDGAIIEAESPIQTFAVTK